MDTKYLITEFENWDLRNLLKYTDLLSTKTDDGLFFPPYIPFVGRYYEKYKILLYATAQSINPNKDKNLVKQYSCNFDKLVERLYYSPNFENKYLENASFDFSEVAIHPYQTGVLPALAGVFVYTMYKQKIADFNEIQDQIAVSNYYKFSLYDKRDINPNMLHKLVSPLEYFELNDNLVARELEVLKPSYVITFGGRHVQNLIEKKMFKVEVINDPAWILRGGGGCLKPTGSWGRRQFEIKDQEIVPLVDGYLSNLQGIYKRKKEGVKTYLLNYYLDWHKIFQKNT